MKPYFVFSLCLFFNSAFAFYTLDGKIYDQNNQQINIDGVNWAGFQDSGFVDELYGSVPFYALNSRAPVGMIDLITAPWRYPQSGVDKNSGVSFKTIRLPIQPQNLRDMTENRHFRMDLSDAKQPLAGNGVFCATWNDHTCQTGLTRSQSLFTLLNEFKKNNLNVLVDFHQTPIARNGKVTETDYSLQQYQNDMSYLAKQIKALGLSNVIGIDVFNEPHQLHWYNSVNQQPAWIDVIAQAAIAVYQQNSNLLLFVEGPSSEESLADICIPKNFISTDASAYQLRVNESICGKDNYWVAFKANWGENFKALLEPNAAKQGKAVFDADRFHNELCQRTGSTVCQWLLGDPYSNQPKGHIVFSPHIYGQHVTGWQSNPASSQFRFEWNFGFLSNAGFPVVIGEAGYDSHQTSDIAFFEKSIMPYLKSKNSQHDLFYWTWNSNSGDTGGVRQDANSTLLDISKEQNLNMLFGD